MAAGASGVLGSLRILVDADTAKAQRALKALGGKAQVAGAAIGAGLGLAGVAALRMGDDYKAATDAIRIGTGDTGKVLAGIEDEFKQVAARVPASLAVVGESMASVRSRTGLLGTDLGALTESFIDLADLTGVDVAAAIDKVTRLYGDWSIAQQDQLKTNDLLLRASQASGMAVDALAEQLVQFGAPLRNIGIEFEGAVAMLSKWEKEGVNTVLALGGMKIALGEFAKEGIDAKEGLEDLIERIQGTTDVAEAMALGVSRFGSRAGPDMVAAIREGRFEFQDFEDALVTGTDTVQGLSDETRDMGDAIREVANRVKVAVGPITDGFAGIAEAMGNAIFLLPALGGALGKGVVKAWQKVAASAAVRGASAAAGAAAGVIYAGATLVAEKFIAIGVAMWTAMGGPRVLAAAGLAGSKAGAAYAGAAGAGGMLGSIAAAVARMAPLAIPAIIAVGAKPLLDEQVQQLDISQASKDLITKGTIRPDIKQGQWVWPWEAGGFFRQDEIALKDRIQDEIVSPLTRMKFGEMPELPPIEMPPPPPPGSIAAPIRAEFALATKEVAKGFGNIKSALANPPQMISKKDRLENMQGRLKKVVRNLKKAVDVGDPWSIKYWEGARAKQQRMIDGLKGKNSASLKDIRTAYRKAGVSVAGTWAEVKTKTVAEAGKAKDGAVAAAQATKAGIDAVDLASSGTNMMLEFAAGIDAGVPAVAAASGRAAAAAAAPIESHSPPKVGPLRNIDKWGGALIDTWLKPMEASVGRASSVGARLAAAVAPQRPAFALGGVGGAGGAFGPGATVIQVGTLVADDGGIDKLQRRMDRRRHHRSRSRRRLNDPNT